MKQLLLDYLSKYSSNDTKATRWLCTREPELWAQIVEATSFLDNPKPKQRCWHILNDVWEHPTCPVTGEKVKWWDYRYVTYSSIKAQMSDPENQKKRQATMIEKYGVPHALQSKKFRKKASMTWEKKYGVSNPSQSKEVLEKIKNANIQNGKWRPEEERSEIEKYNQAVWRHTHKSWRDHRDKIANGIQRSREYHLDHIYPKILGFQESIAPEVIGHWTNLRLIPAKENLVKHAKSLISKEKLLEQYELSR